MHLQLVQDRVPEHHPGDHPPSVLGEDRRRTAPEAEPQGQQPGRVDGGEVSGPSARKYLDIVLEIAWDRARDYAESEQEIRDKFEWHNEICRENGLREMPITELEDALERFQD